MTTYTQVKQALVAEGYPTAPGTAWQGEDAGSYDQQYIPAVSYAAGVNPDPINANYGLAYPAVMPAAVAAAIAQNSYSATVAATPLTGAHPLNVAATATETNGPATSYSWNWGDGTSATVTTVPTANHSYAAAGTFHITMTPTVGGSQLPAVAAAAPVVVS